MVEIISASEANRQFSSMLREVGHGTTYRITRHGHTVARLVPAGEAKSAGESVRKQLRKELREGPGDDIEPWTRDELYDHDNARFA